MAKWKGAEILTELGGPQGECCFCTALYPHLWNEEWGLDNGSQTVHWAPLEVHLSLRALGSPLHILSHSPFIRLCGFHKKVHSWQKIFETPQDLKDFFLLQKLECQNPNVLKTYFLKAQHFTSVDLASKSQQKAYIYFKSTDIYLSPNSVRHSYKDMLP